MLNVLSFTYLHPEMVNRAAQVLILGPGALSQLEDRYVLVSHKDNPYHHDCPIHEIMYEDFVNYKFPWPLQRLKEYEQTHDSKDFEKVFPKDDANIKRKILNTINFALDKVYKSDKLLITFYEAIKTSPPKQGVPNAIYQVLQEHFEILDKSCSNGYLLTIIIKKRSEDNGNDASGSVH